MSRTPKIKNQSKPSEATIKRRKLANNKNSSTTSCDGESADEVVAHFGATTNRKNMFDAVTAHARITAEGFVKNLDKNIRQPVPIPEKRRVKIDKDEDYIAAQYVKLENSEYVLTQAPNKSNMKELWRLVWQDQIKVMVNLCHEEQCCNTDEKKCYNYFPTEVAQIKEIELKKGKFVVTCKSKECLSFMTVKYEFEMIANDVEGHIEEKKDDDPTATSGKKILQITFYHMTGWTGKPDKDPFEAAQNVALLCKEVLKAEMNVLRKSMENFVPPVLIQSFDAIGRASIVWVGLMLCKDVEKRECFDVPELVRKIMKMRPGSMSNYFQFCFVFAVALHIGKESNWLPEPDLNSKIGDLTKGYNDRKLNDNGIPI